MKLNADKVERYMEEYIAKDPNDKYAVMKAVFYANQKDYMLFIGVRMFNKVSEILNGLIYLEIIRQFEQQTGPFTVEQY